MDRVNKTVLKMCGGIYGQQSLPWFSGLLYELDVKQDASIPTFCTDGVELRYNPQFANTLTEQEIIGVLAHEVLHCAMGHISRRNGRDKYVWNEACDYAINGELIRLGFSLPAGVLIDHKYANLSADEIYTALISGDKPGDKPCPTGVFEDAPTGRASEIETKWVVAKNLTTAQCKKAGLLPGPFIRMIGMADQQPVNWREILKQFIASKVPVDYTWQVPNRRYISQGMYLPGMKKDGCSEIVAVIDTSGSISTQLLDVFMRELTEVLADCQPEKLIVLSCDTQVRRKAEYLPGDTVDLEVYGGGGTAFQPAFDWIAANLDTPPAALIYFTDLCGPTPKDPGYPVLWAVPGKRAPQPGFGETVLVNLP